MKTKHHESCWAAVLLLAITAAASANDWNMGDFISYPLMKVFVGTVTRVHHRRGHEAIDTAVLRVDRVLRGSVDGKRVGLILQCPAEVPAVGADVLVMTGSKSSPYTPASNCRGFVPLNTSNRENLISCAQASVDFVGAADIKGRISAMHRLMELLPPC
jgi:hypothetical protein